MSYASFGALGADYTLKIPYVGNQTISIPVEQMAADAAKGALPQLEAKVQAMLPGLLRQAQDQMTNQMLPALMPKLQAEAQKMAPKLIAQAQAQLEPVISGYQTKAVIGVLAMAGLIVGSAWWVKKR